MEESQPFVEHRFEANGLAQHVLEWAPRRESATGPARTVVLVHGFMDMARSWDGVAPLLAERGHRVLAPDMRGFGEAGRVPNGAYYHFADYVADLAAILSVLAPRGPFALVGHSMGGTITTLFTGTFPEKVVRFANLEGLGPPDNAWDVAPIRMRRWIDQTGNGRRSETALAEEDAFDRLATSHPHVPHDVLRTRFAHLAEDAGDIDGVRHVRWRFDPLHRTMSPTPFYAKNWIEFAKRITCPVLFVSGGAAGFHVEEEDERLAAFAQLRRATLDDAGHMMHWTRPSELATLLLDFFRE